MLHWWQKNSGNKNALFAAGGSRARSYGTDLVLLNRSSDVDCQHRNGPSSSAWVLCLRRESTFIDEYVSKCGAYGREHWWGWSENGRVPGCSFGNTTPFGRFLRMRNNDRISDNPSTNDMTQEEGPINSDSIAHIYLYRYININIYSVAIVFAWVKEECYERKKPPAGHGDIKEFQASGYVNHW